MTKRFIICINNRVKKMRKEINGISPTKAAVNRNVLKLAIFFFKDHWPF